MQPITNLTELWQDGEKNDALLLCAKTRGCADYETFRNLCEAFEQMPEHPARRRAEAQLRQLFGCFLPPVPKNREAVWKLTAEALLREPHTREEAAAVPAPPESGEPLFLPAPCGKTADYPELPDVSATAYAAWETAQAELLAANPPEYGLSLSLAEGFRAARPDRYRADLHLSGGEPNENVWQAQMFRFCIHALQKSDKKLLLKTACDPSEIAALFAMFAEREPLPPILWMPRDAERDAGGLILLCRAALGSDVSLAIRAGTRADPARLAQVVPLGRVSVLI